MPDLDLPAVTSWFAELQPGGGDQWSPFAIRPLEAIPEVAARLSVLGHALDDVALNTRADLFRTLDQQLGRHLLQEVLAQLGAARLSRLVHWIGSHDLLEAAHLISALTMGQGSEARVIRAAMTTVTRQITLDRMFSPGRLAALDAACASALKETHR